MRTLLLALITLFLSLPLVAQDSTAERYEVSGQLMGDREYVGYANVLLMNAADSSLSKADFSLDDGTFALEVDSGSYFLQVVMLGFSDFQSNVFELSSATPEVAFGIIELEAFAKTLETAVVTAKKPFLEQKAGKMIVNVEGSATGQTGSATQLLRKVPGLVVRQGSVSMAGADGVTILIDGKQTRYMDVNSLLRDLPASEIEKVEVITQPGANYDAEGGGIINIILKKNVRLGTNGTARFGIGRGTYDKLNTSVNLSHRDGPLNAYGSVNYRRGSGFEQLTLDREIEDTRFVQVNTEPFLPNTISGRAGVDYDVTDRVSVGVNGRYSYTSDEAVGLNTSLGYQNAPDVDAEIPSDVDPSLKLSTLNANDQTRRSYGTDAFLRFEIDTNGRVFELDGSYAGFDGDGVRNTTTDVAFGTFNSALSDIRNAELNATRVVATQADYTHPIKLNRNGEDGEAKLLTLRTGAKYSFADVDADLKAEERLKDSELPFENAVGFTNHFLYQEQIAAGYLSASTKLGKVDLNAGLRYEHTFIEGNNVTTDSSFRRDFGNFFPSFGISSPFIGPLGISAAYSYRLKRPNYSALNPFVRYMDPLTVQRGNTNLTPEYIHNAQLNLSYQGQPFFRLAYSRTNDAIALVTQKNETTGVGEGYSANLDTYTRYGGHMFAPLSFIPKVDGYFGGMLYYNEYESAFLGNQFKQGSWEFTGVANATISMPLDIKTELNFWIQSGGQEGIMQAGTIYGSSVGLKRSFLDDQLTLNLSWEDPLFNAWDGKIRYEDQRMNITSAWETNIVMLNVTYKFGNRYLKNRKGRNSAARDILNRTKD